MNDQRALQQQNLDHHAYAASRAASSTASPPTETIRPLRQFVSVQPEVTPETTSSGLIALPRTAKSERYRGTVIAVGPGRVTEHGILVPVGVKPGDVVIYSKHNMAQGVRRADDDSGPILVPEDDLEAVVE